MHRADDGGQIRMRRQNKLWPAARRAQGRGGEASFATSRTSENELAIRDSQPVQFLRVIQAQEAVFHFICSGIFAEDVRQMAPSPLNPAGRVEFRKESNDHGVSLPKRKQERQGDTKKGSPKFRMAMACEERAEKVASGQLSLCFAVLASSSTKESTYASAGLD